MKMKEKSGKLLGLGAAALLLAALVLFTGCPNSAGGSGSGSSGGGGTPPTPPAPPEIVYEFVDIQAGLQHEKRILALKSSS